MTRLESHIKNKHSPNPNSILSSREYAEIKICWSYHVQPPDMDFQSSNLVKKQTNNKDSSSLGSGSYLRSDYSPLKLLFV